jgi:hypothetical protein
VDNRDLFEDTQASRCNDDAYSDSDGEVVEASDIGEGEEEANEGPTEEGEHVLDETEHVTESGGRISLDAVIYPTPSLGIARKPVRANVSGAELIAQYGASDLIGEVTRYLKTRFNIPTQSILLSLDDVFHVWHRFYLHHRRLPFSPDEAGQRDVVRARPATRDAAGRSWGNDTFDTVLFIDKPEAFGIHRTCACSITFLCLF